jgi:hypothetical protein
LLRFADQLQAFFLVRCRGKFHHHGFVIRVFIIEIIKKITNKNK